MVDILNDLVLEMGKEELRNYRIYAQRSHGSQDRKDLELFKYIRKQGDQYDEREIMRQLYGPGAKKGAFLRLRNRLLTEVGKSQALLHWDKNDDVLTLHYLSLALVYRDKQQGRLALYYLRKAEQRASQLENLELLDIVYGEYIKLSYDVLDINPENYIRLREDNRMVLNRLRQIDNVLATVSFRLKRSQNLGSGDASIMETLLSTVEEFSVDATTLEDPRFRFRMYQAVSKILLQSRDYVNLEAYLEDTYQAFSREGLFTRANHETRLQMLTYLINSSYKNERYEASMDYTRQLYQEMERFNKVHFDRYHFFYYNSLMMNYFILDAEKAVETLEEMLQIDTIVKIPSYESYVYLNLALSQYQLRRYAKALRSLARLRHLDAYQSNEAGFRLRIEVFEMAVRMDQQDFETLEYRLGQIRHDFASLLKRPEHRRDRQFLKLLEQLARSLDQVDSPKLEQGMRRFLEDYEQEETEIIKYGEFLQARLNR